MTPEHKGNHPRQESSAPTLRFEKQATEPKEKRRSNPWKKTVARMQTEPEQDSQEVHDPVAENLCQPENSEPEDADRIEPSQPGTSGQSVPKDKYRKWSKRESAGHTAPDSKLRQESKQAQPSDRLHRDSGHSIHRPVEKPEPQKLRKARQRMEQRDSKRGHAHEKLDNQKPRKAPGPVYQGAAFVKQRAYNFVHGKVYEAENENVGIEGAHRTELVAEAAGRKAVRFTKNRIRTRPARKVRKVESRYTRAAAKFQFQKAAAENPELSKHALTRIWRKRQQQKQFAKRVREVNRQGVKAAEKTAVTTEKIGRKTLGFVRRHPMGVFMAVACMLVLVLIQSCASSAAVVGNSMAGAVSASTFPASDADLLGAEAAYAGMEADLQARLDGYEAAHSYDEYHYELDEIEHDPYVLLSILSALHPEGWALADVQGDLQNLFSQQYILTESVVVETRYRTETETDEDGEETETEVPYDYKICTVTLENTNLSHVPIYVLSQEQMRRYSLYLSTLGNRPDLFPDSVYVNRYGHGAGGGYTIPPEALEDEQFAAMIHEAEKYLGYPYVWGGSSPATSFDCSGFVSWVINNCGCGWNVGRLDTDGLYFNVCTPVSAANAKPGDLIFFHHTYNTPYTSHVGIYVGGGMMIHCGDPIQYADITSSYWQAHFYGFGRLP